MTNEEAFKLAMQACKKTWNEKTCKQIKEALSQEPCDDAVSRKDAEQMFRNIRSHLKPQDYKSAEEFNTRDLMLLNAEQMIHALPPVIPQQKMGRWILSGGYWRCSECKEKALLKLDKSKGGCREYEPVRSKHCPNCDAKMTEPQESEE